MDRRSAIRVLAAAPVATAFRWAPESVREAAALARETLQRGVPYEPKQFTAHEWETVRLLVDLILPRTDTSAAAPEPAPRGSWTSCPARTPTPRRRTKAGWPRSN